MHQKRILVFLSILLIISGILFVIDPENAWFMPKCPLFTYTGIQCPACGTQRALHHVFHFDLRAAFRHNPFLAVSMPYILCVVTVYSAKEDYLRKLRAFCFHPTVVHVYAGLILAWWIARNVFPITA